MATYTFNRLKRALPVLLLLCGSALAHSGGSWSPQCTKVSSGCTACRYVRQTRASTSARGLKQEAVSGAAAPVATSSDSTVQQAAPAVAEVQQPAAEPQATAAATGVPVSTSSSTDGTLDPAAPKYASSSYRQYRSSGSRRNNGYTYSSSGYYSSSGSSSGHSSYGNLYSSSGSGGNSYGGYQGSSGGSGGSSYGSYEGSSSGGSSSWSDLISWGSSNYTWQPGASWSCTACDTSRGYRLLTSTNGTQYCGCESGHGVVARGSQAAAAQTAWAHTHYVRSFTCQACGPNQVPFLPGSNVLVVWDGANWSVQCASSGGQNTQAPAVPPSTAELSSGLTARRKRRAAAAAAKSQPLATSTAAEAPGAMQLPAPPAVVTESAAAATAAVSTAAVATSGLQSSGTDFDTAHARQRRQQEAWYSRGRRRRSGSSGGGGTKYDCAPWLPGQCIDCSLVGGIADPTGTYCICGSGPPPSPPPGPSPRPSPSPPPSPPPSPNPSPSPPTPSPSPAPSTGCITCDPTEIATEIEALCPANPTELVYLADWCYFDDPNLNDVVFATAPNVLDSTQQDYARDGAMLCSTLATQQGVAINVTATAIGTNLQCSPATTQTSFVVPSFGGTSPSPAPPSSPSPSPPPTSSPSPSPSPSPGPSPSPSPSPSPPTPSPSPSPSGACVQCSFTQITDEITSVCGATTDDVFYFVMDQVPGEYCWWTDPKIGTPVFTTKPDIQGTNYEGSDTADCALAAAKMGEVITLTIQVNPEMDVGITCSPTTSVYNFTMPNF